KLQGTDAELAAAIDNLDTIGGYIGQELPGFGPVDITATIRSPENNTKLESLLVNLNDPALSAQLSAATGTISLEELSKIRIEDIDARLKADSIQTEKIVEKLGLDLATALPASLFLEAETSGNLEKLGVNRLEIVAQDDGLGMTIKATMENILDLSGILATVTADAASTAALSKFAGMEVPDLGPLKVNSSIRSVDETYALDSFDLQLDGRDVQAHIEGSIKDVLALAQLEEASEKITETGIDMSFNADIASLSRLVSELSGIDVPELGTLQLSGQVGSAEQAPALESFSLTLNGEHLQAQVDATVQDLLALADLAEQSGKTGTAGIDVALAASTQSLSGLAAHAVGLEIPELGSLEVSATMQSLEEALQLRSFSAALMGEGVEAHIEGSIADIAALSDIKATARATISSLQKLAPVTQSALPETGPWSLDARLSSENLNSPLIFNGTLEGEGTTTVVDATIPHIRAPQTLLAKLNVDAESLAFLEHFMDRELPEDRPVKVSTRLAATPGEYRLEDFLVLFGDGQLRSDLTYTAASGDKARRKNLTGEISIQDIDITPFYTFDTAAEEETGGTVEEAASAEETQGQEQTAGGKKLFPSTPLKVGPLQEYDLDLKLEVADLVIRENFSITGNTAVSLDRGLLAVDPFTLVGNDNATADGRFTLDARSSPAKLDLFLDFNDFVSPRFGGKFNLDTELEGKGESIATLMASLDGRFIAKLNDGELKRTMLSQYGAGLLKQLNPLDSDQTTLECAIARFDFTDGMMEFENKIAAQTTEVTWIGGGTINLKTEEIDFGIAPKARNILSSMTNIDLASLVHVGGTLAEPSFGFDLMDAGKKYAEYTAFIATGGLSFLAKKAYDNRVSNIDQCERILADLKEK
ncbi:MAG: AsmA-like C-terminal region-containing protein, partial [Desulfocapsaceae bacterium]|nr:AsmA-like C-terminal region-containing protein [Desulfocapsaceae bacterium]